MTGENQLRQIVQNGDIAFGAKTVTQSPAVIDVFGEVGLDYVWFDFEHIGGSPVDSPSVEQAVRVAQTAGVDLVTRLPDTDPTGIQKAIDAGVRNITLPRVQTADEVHTAIKAAKYQYENDTGGRGISGAYSNQWGAKLNAEHLESEDREVLVGILVEHIDAVDNIEEIVELPGLGFALIGPKDLSASMGHHLKTDHPDVQEAIDKTERTCIEAGIPFGGSIGLEEAFDCIERGWQLLQIGGDLGPIRSDLSHKVNQLEPHR